MKFSKKKPKIIPCPDCRRKFRKLADLNQHIRKTGCNNGKKLEPLDILGIENKKGYVKNLIQQLFN